MVLGLQSLWLFYFSISHLFLLFTWSSISPYENFNLFLMIPLGRQLPCKDSSFSQIFTQMLSVFSSLECQSCGTFSNRPSLTSYTIIVFPVWRYLSLQCFLYLISVSLLPSECFVEMIYFLLVYCSFYSYECNSMRTTVCCFVYQCIHRGKIIADTFWIANRYLLNKWMNEITELILCCSFPKCPFYIYMLNI